MSVAVASSVIGQTQAFQQFAKDNGYSCVGTAHTAIEAVALVQMFKPQALLLDLDHLDNLKSVLKPLMDFKTTALIVLTSDPDSVLCRETQDMGAEAVVVTPWTAPQLRAIFQSAWHGYERDQARQLDIETLKETLETRKLVDRAKGILMTERGISEPEAYRLLQKMSQDKRVSIKDVCKAVDHVQSIVGSHKRSKLTP